MTAVRKDDRVRIYLPTTFSALAAAAAGPGFEPGTAYAVTPALREHYASGDAEELEYAAMIDAARDCLRLLARNPAEPARRVVVAADVPDAALTLVPDVHPGAVVLTAGVPLRVVASVHVDPVEVEPEIRAAVAVVDAADGGDDDAQFVVDGVDDHELHWYATQEIADLLT